MANNYKTIQDLIDNRQSLNYPQETSLITLLIYKQRADFKLKCKQILKNSFYTFFDGETYSKKFLIAGDSIDYIGNDLNLVRKAIINFGN